MIDDGRLEDCLRNIDPQTAMLVRTYVGEAKFFDALLAPDIEALPSSSLILEIGSGIGLLAMMIAERGHRVIAYEPESSGFGFMQDIRGIVRTAWLGPIPAVQWENRVLLANELSESERADYATAINVIEHVPDYPRLIDDVISNLNPSGRFRFVCPNYTFPFEPHFEIPTLFSKRLTARVFRGRIHQRSDLIDPEAVWQDLSWPTQRSIRCSLAHRSLGFSFAKTATRAYCKRPFEDPSFISRKRKVTNRFLRFSSTLCIRLVDVTPPAVLPVIDCTVTPHREDVSFAP